MIRAWTEADVARHNARVAASRSGGGLCREEPLPATGVEHEGDLHEEIVDVCKAFGWAYVHSRMDRPTTTAVGVCDFIIFLPCAGKHPSLLLVECKSRTGKLSDKQQSWIAHLAKLGHTVHVVTSIEQFRALL